MESFNYDWNAFGLIAQFYHSKILASYDIVLISEAHNIYFQIANSWRCKDNEVSSTLQK